MLLLLDFRGFRKLRDSIQPFINAFHATIMFLAGDFQTFVAFADFAGLLGCFHTHFVDHQFISVDSFGVFQHHLPQLRHV